MDIWLSARRRLDDHRGRAALLPIQVEELVVTIRKHLDVVIISWARNEELHKVTKEGLDSLFNSENEHIAFHAFVVESNPRISYDEYNALGPLHTSTTIHPTDEFGYHRYLNLGRKAGKSPYVALCNSDLAYERGWASEIIKAMAQHQNALSASPWCRLTLGDNKPHIGKSYQGYRIRQELAGWCIVQQRKIYDLIGELDERFKFWYCDDDYALELKTRGIPHILVPSAVVNHHNNHRVGKTAETLSLREQDEITFAQRRVFSEKWSKPLSVSRNRPCPCGSGKRFKHCHGALS